MSWRELGGIEKITEGQGGWYTEARRRGAGDDIRDRQAGRGQTIQGSKLRPSQSRKGM